MNNSDVAAPPKIRSRAWPLFLMGVLLFFVGPALYFGQLYLRNLSMPWYVPLLATAGVLLMVLSVWRR